MNDTSRRTILGIALIGLMSGNSSAAPVIHGPLCGIYATYHAAKVVGSREVPEFQELVDPKYIGGLQGSSSGELQLAARDSGCSAHLFTNWGLTHLFLVSRPVILHVSNSVPGRRDHWVLFLGYEKGRARILDSNGGFELWSLGDLAARWRGTGLLVSLEGAHGWLELAFVQLFVTAQIAILLAVTGCALAPYSRWRLRMEAAPLRRQVCVIIALSFILGFVVQSLSSTGILKNRFAMGWILQHYVESSIPHVEKSEVEKITSNTSFIIVDARHEDAFAGGHIPGSINVPVNASPVVFEDEFGSLDCDSPIVVYCQSERCGYAESVANRLQLSGFRNVRLYSKGYVDWTME